MSGTRKRADAAAELRTFSAEWERMMVRIWQDRLALAGAVDTGALLRSIGGDAPAFGAGLEATFTFRHLLYGIYVEGGGGRYRHDPRPWFAKSWAISRRVMADRVQQIAGDEFVGLFDNISG